MLSTFACGVLVRHACLYQYVSTGCVCDTSTVRIAKLLVIVLSVTHLILLQTGVFEEFSLRWMDINLFFLYMGSDLLMAVLLFSMKTQTR